MLLSPQRTPITPIGTSIREWQEPLTDYGEALAWFTAEHQVLLAAVARAAEHRLDVHTWQLGWTLGTYFNRAGHWRDATTFHRASLASA